MPHSSSEGALLQRLRDIEEGRILPTFLELFDLCLLYGKGEHLDLEYLYPNLYRERVRVVEEAQRSGLMTGKSPLASGRVPVSVIQFYDWCIQDGIARDVTLTRLFPKLSRTHDPKGP